MNLATSYGAGYLLYHWWQRGVSHRSVFFNPIWRIAQRHNLGSLADVFAFRYPGEWVGAVVTVFMLLGVLPLIALQIQAAAAQSMLTRTSRRRPSQSRSAPADGVRDSLRRTQSVRYQRRPGSRRRLQSLVKLIAMLTLAGFAVYSVADSAAQRLARTPERAARRGVVRRGLTLLLLFFAGVVAMPHVYHMLFTENDDPRVFAGLRWGVPLFLLIMSAAIADRLGGGLRGLHTDLSTTCSGWAFTRESCPHHTGLHRRSRGGERILIVSTLALSSMTLNHVILPFIRPPAATAGSSRACRLADTC